MSVVSGLLHHLHGLNQAVSRLDLLYHTNGVGQELLSEVEAGFTLNLVMPFRWLHEPAVFSTGIQFHHLLCIFCVGSC